MKKTRSLKVRHYAACLIDMNEYLDSFPGATLADKIYVTGFNDIVLNRMPSSWSKQAYVRGFGYESISFKNAVKMFERMETAESIYKGVVETSYKKTLPGKMPNVLVTAGIREENLPHIRLTPRQERVLESAKNDMKISQRSNQKPISSTAP